MAATDFEPAVSLTTAGQNLLNLGTCARALNITLRHDTYDEDRAARDSLQELREAVTAAEDALDHLTAYYRARA